MRKSGLTGDEAYILSKHGKTTEDLGPLKREIGLLKEDIKCKQDIYGQLGDSLGTKKEGYLFNINTSSEVEISYGSYIFIDDFTKIDNGIIVVNGYNFSSDSLYPAYAFKIGETWIKNNDIKKDIAVNDSIVVIPPNATAMIINGQKTKENSAYTFEKRDLGKDINALNASANENRKKTENLSADINALSNEYNTALDAYLDINAEYVNVSKETMCENYRYYVASSNVSTSFNQVANLQGVVYRVQKGVQYKIKSCGSKSYYVAFVFSERYIVEGGLALVEADVHYGTLGRTVYEEFLYTPAKDGYLMVNLLHSDLANGGVFDKKNIKRLSPKKIVNSIADFNQWKDKKIVWIGTSVPYGSNTYNGESYASYASKKLGFIIVPAVVPGEAIHAKLDGDKLVPLDYGSTVLSKEEYIASGSGITISDAPKIPWQPGSEGNSEHPGTGYNNYYRTWENIFNEENKDADLFVFDVAPNNTNFSTTDWDNFDKQKWEYKDGSDFASHRTTFYGALLYMMDKMYSLNPDARMIFVLGSAFVYKEARNAFEKINAEWKIAIVDIWGKINTSPKSLIKLKSKNGTDFHPSDFAHNLLGNILVNELLLVN